MSPRRQHGEQREDLSSRRGLVVGGLLVAIAVTGGIAALLVYWRGGEPRRLRRAELALARASGREEPPQKGRTSQGRELLGRPLSVPDGGWPDAPASMAHMDEVPEGLLQRGSPADHGEDDETPVSEVSVAGFFIDRNEVTNADYTRCVDAGVCRPPMELDESRFCAPRQPVVGVSWHDGQTFCRWAGKRLPTEAEWERAARGDGNGLYPWGDERPDCGRAVFLECDRYSPAEVGGRVAGAGPFGTHDLAGNVWEWVQDWYAPRHFPADPEGNPEGPPAGSQRVLRGGSWQFGPSYIRAANRHRDDPTRRTPWYGFRCAYRPPPPPASTGTQAQPHDAGLAPIDGAPPRDASSDGAADVGRPDAAPVWRN